MEENEETVLESENGPALMLQKRRSRNDFVARTLNNFLLGSTLPVSILTIYYLFDRLTDDPLDLIFSLFALITIIDQVHKSQVYLDSTEEAKRSYEGTKKSFEAWINSRRIDEGDSQLTAANGVDGSTENIIVSANPVATTIAGPFFMRISSPCIPALWCILSNGFHNITSGSRLRLSSSEKPLVNEKPPQA